LTRKAELIVKNLDQNASIIGWLYQAAHFSVLNEIRSERRRQSREKEATENFDAASEAPWGERDAFAKRGIPITAVALSVAISTNAVATAPPGQRNDMIAAEEIVFPKQKQVVADEGYDGDRFRQRISAAGSEPCIPPRSGRLKPARYHRGYYKRRHRVEISFSASNDHVAWAPATKNSTLPSLHFCVWPPCWTGLSQFEDTPYFDIHRFRTALRPKPPNFESYFFSRFSTTIT